MFAYLSSFIWAPEDENTQFKNQVIERLKRHGVNTTQLFENLKSSGSVISGSFPLQIVLNENWEGSDVDIFTSNKKMANYLEKLYKKVPIASGSTYEIKSRTKSNPDDKSAYYPMFDDVTEYKTSSGLRIQVIQMKDKTPKPAPKIVIKKISDKTAVKKPTSYIEEFVKTVHRRFDFDFCKISFDGEKVYFANRLAVTSRRCFYDYSLVPYKIGQKTYDRLIKYEKRGFMITNRPEFIAVHQEHLKKLKELENKKKNDLTKAQKSKQDAIKNEAYDYIGSVPSQSSEYDYKLVDFHDDEFIFTRSEKPKKSQITKNPDGSCIITGYSNTIVDGPYKEYKIPKEIIERLALDKPLYRIAISYLTGQKTSSDDIYQVAKNILFRERSYRSNLLPPCKFNRANITIGGNELFAERTITYSSLIDSPNVTYNEKWLIVNVYQQLFPGSFPECAFVNTFPEIKNM